MPASGAISLPALVLKALLPRIAFAISGIESRYTLQAALMILKPDSLSLVATDGHRLAVIEKKGEPLAGVVAEQKHLLPQIAVSQLISLLSTVKEGTIDFAANETNLFFRIQERVYIARKIAGSFPNYEAVMPRDNSLIAIANVNDLASSIQRVSQFADERSGSIRLALGENEIKVSSANSEAGESEDVIPAPYSGPPLVAGFNYSYIIDFLKSIAGTDEVRLEFDAKSLPPLTEGWTRSYVLRSIGYCKDADPFTAESDRIGPLPWKGMPEFPFKKGETRPSDPAYAAYLKTYQTRSTLTR